jgi:hypothetical protein
MRFRRLLVGCIAVVPLLHADDAMLDRLGDALTFSSDDGRARARVSGTLELEGYRLESPPPGVIRATGERLFAPRLSVFLDAQLGARVYAFAQARADRGFDPAPGDGEARLDEYAMRFALRRDRRLNVQIGKFATVVGNWANRHGAWSNPFITAPVPYENLTGIWDTEAVRSSTVLLRWSHVVPGLPPDVAAEEKSLRIPIVWGPSYATGAAVSGEAGPLRYAAEVKLGSLSSRPEAWLHSREQREDPTVSARIGYRPNPNWDFGVSASRGAYLRESAAGSLAPGFGHGDYRQSVVAADVAFAHRHLQVWAEIYAARFEIPTIADAETLAYYVEAKLKLTPRFSGALRWNQQLFGKILDRGAPVAWGHEVWRIDLAPSYRFTPHTQLKLQYSLQRGDSLTRSHTRTLAAQFTLRF